MADRDRTNQVQVHPQHRFDQGVHGGKNYQSGPSTTQLVLPVIGLCVATPLFVIFSPVLVPAAITVAGFLSSCAFGLTGMSSLVYMFNRLRRVTGTGQLDVDQAKRRMQDMAGYVGQKTKEVGQKIESKAHKGGRR